MLIYDVLHKEKVYQVIAGNLRSLGVKYRIKKNAVKTDKPERNAAALKKVFKTPLSYLPLDVVNLSSGAIIHVPVFVSQATSFLLKHVNQEGLFRKAGLQIKQKEIIARLDNGGSLGDKYNPLDVANCLKTFLRSLPEPLIPFAYHDLFVRCNMLKIHKVDALLMACLLLPPHHLNTLAFIMEFLKTVASHEKQNKMSVDNLARVIGPNIMPLPETSTIVAVQTRLEAHLNIVKILIENADKIGVLPTDVSEAISMDSVGSIDNELDKSDPSSSFKSKKKKHRSGSLNRMLSGLKKMVGKNHSPNGQDLSESHLIPVNSTQSLYTPSIKTAKKRKNVETSETSHLRRHPLKDKSPQHKISRQKLTKFQIETQNSDKTERPKKLRLSLERFVPRGSKNNKADDTIDSKKSISPKTSRRWSTESTESKKRRRTQSVDSPFRQPPQSKVRHSIDNKNLDDVFMDADVNLSDDSDTSTVKRKSTHSYSLRNSSSPKLLNITDNNSEEFVKIPKSEYEEIKSRVSAIESRISQEFKCITSEDAERLTIDNVQNVYEKTLEEAGIENIASTDQLAKRLSRELKIRKSAEHKIIRSPSARKIGSMRRRSQERPVRKVQRTVSWHTSDRPILRDSEPQLLNNFVKTSESPAKPCSLKRAKPLMKRNSYKNLTQTPVKPAAKSDSLSDETNARLEYLQEQLNTLISHTAEHTCGTFSDDDFSPLDDGFQSPVTPLINKSSTNLRRASSFHNNEFIDNSQYFNSKIKELKTNTSQSIFTPPMPLSNDRPGICKTPGTESKKEKSVTWKDADVYFQQEARFRTPVPQTGRASVAKLRTQNAGMVLAKAKLFDDPTREAVDISRRQSVKMKSGSRDELRTPNDIKRQPESIVHRKLINSERRASKPVSPLIKKEVSISSSGRKQSTRHNYIRTNHNNDDIKSNIVQKENKLIQANNIASNCSQIQDDINIFKPNESPVCKTPHIKRSLGVKTPRSAKSLSARKSAMISRRTPLKAMMPITPKRQSPRIVLKSQLSRHMN